MDEEQLLALKPELDLFLDRFAPLFGHPQNQAHARRFVQGLLHKGQRRNVENLAEAIDGCCVRNMQAFITTGAWHSADILRLMRRCILEGLADEDAVCNCDETGFPKKGRKSVGVKRQYSGTLGRTDSCQIGVFVNYSSAAGHTFLDRRLFLPEDWADDLPRRREAGAPDGVVFRTKPELALEMLSGLVEEGVPFRWVGGDSVYGDSPTFVRGVRQLGKWYVLDTSADARVWTEQPEVIPAEERPRPRRGRAPTRPLVVGEPERVDEVVASLPRGAWRRMSVGEGSQGPRVYEYACLWVNFSEEGMPGPRERLLVRRSTGQEPELKYHRADAPAEAPLEKLASVRGFRWSVEEDIKSAKGECGLDEYETRGWVGWHHHTALAMLALAFLTLQKLRLGEKSGRADERAGGAGSAEPPAGGAPVGRAGDPEVVPVASGAEPAGRREPPKTKGRRGKTTAAK
jgi:SRSO17 transposase